MIKQIIFYFIIISSFLFSTPFSTGDKTFGGSLGYYKDLDADVSILNISPRWGYFLQDNFMLELGMSHISIDNDNYDPITYNGFYNDGTHHTTSIGARFFIDKFYFGFEFVKGLSKNLGTGLGNDFTIDLSKFDGNKEKGLVKLGILTPINHQLFLDTALHYMFILDKDAREQASSEHLELTQVIYVTLGFSYFWESN